MLEIIFMVASKLALTHNGLIEKTASSPSRTLTLHTHFWIEFNVTYSTFAVTAGTGLAVLFRLVFGCAGFDDTSLAAPSTWYYIPALFTKKVFCTRHRMHKYSGDMPTTYATNTIFCTSLCYPSNSFHIYSFAKAERFTNQKIKPFGC